MPSDSRPTTGGVPESSYAGERLGLPRDGVGSVAQFWPRLGGIVIDWAIASGISWWLFNYDPIAIMVIFLILTALCITLLGSTIGHLVFGLRVNTVAGKAPGPWRPWVRQLLLLLVLPPLITDADDRGAHDQLAGLVLRRFR